jgi:hypothetical protein
MPVMENHEKFTLLMQRKLGVIYFGDDSKGMGIVLISLDTRHTYNLVYTLIALRFTSRSAVIHEFCAYKLSYHTV